MLKKKFMSPGKQMADLFYACQLCLSGLFKFLKIILKYSFTPTEIMKIVILQEIN